MVGASMRIKAASFLAPQLSISTGGRNLSVRAEAPEILRLGRWSRSWKTHIVEKVLTQRGGGFVDVGANIGQTLVDYVAAGVGSGYAGFEPNIRLANQLQTLIAANGLRDFMVVPAGLGEESGLVPLYLRPDAPGDASATIIDGLRPSRGALDVQVISVMRFDAVRNLLPFSRVGLIKIDIEGAEAYALAGMAETLKNERPWILCEVLRADRATDIASHEGRQIRLETILRDQRYKLFVVRKEPGEGAFTALQPIDAFPRDVWTTETAELNDYLFVPEEDQELLPTVL